MCLSARARPSPCTVGGVGRQAGDHRMDLVSAVGGDNEEISRRGGGGGENNQNSNDLKGSPLGQ